MSEECNRDKAADVIDVFEELLNEHGIILENKERPMDDPSAASIYGTEYYALEDKIVDIIGGR